MATLDSLGVANKTLYSDYYLVRGVQDLSRVTGLAGMTDLQRGAALVAEAALAVSRGLPLSFGSIDEAFDIGASSLDLSGLVALEGRGARIDVTGLTPTKAITATQTRYQLASGLALTAGQREVTLDTGLIATAEAAVGRTLGPGDRIVFASVEPAINARVSSAYKGHDSFIESRAAGVIQLQSTPLDDFDNSVTYAGATVWWLPSPKMSLGGFSLIANDADKYGLDLRGYTVDMDIDVSGFGDRCINLLDCVGSVRGRINHNTAQVTTGLNYGLALNDFTDVDVLLSYAAANRHAVTHGGGLWDTGDGGGTPGSGATYPGRYRVSGGHYVSYAPADADADGDDESDGLYALDAHSTTETLQVSDSVLCEGGITTSARFSIIGGCEIRHQNIYGLNLSACDDVDTDWGHVTLNRPRIYGIGGATNPTTFPALNVTRFNASIVGEIICDGYYGDDPEITIERSIYIPADQGKMDLFCRIRDRNPTGTKLGNITVFRSGHRFRFDLENTSVRLEPGADNVDVDVDVRARGSRTDSPALDVLEVSSTSSVGTFTVDAGTDVVTLTAHGLSDGDLVTVASSTTLPAGLDASEYYWIDSATTDTFQLTLTPGGTAVDITDTGTGTHTATEVTALQFHRVNLNLDIESADAAGAQLQGIRHLRVRGRSADNGQTQSDVDKTCGVYLVRCGEVDLLLDGRSYGTTQDRLLNAQQRHYETAEQVITVQSGSSSEGCQVAEYRAVTDAVVREKAGSYGIDGVQRLVGRATYTGQTVTAGSRKVVDVDCNGCLGTYFATGHISGLIGLPIGLTMTPVADTDRVRLHIQNHSAGSLAYSSGTAIVEAQT